MICTKCGAKMPDESNFCLKCGAKVDLTGKRKTTGVPECSEKNQRMVGVPGKGLYFIDNEDRLCFYDEEHGKAEALTKRSRTEHLCGLGCRGGKLYYWHECQDERSPLFGMRLYERDVDSGGLRTVWESNEDQFHHYRLDDNPLKARAILYQGAYYLLDYYDQSLMRVSVPSGEQDNLELPDMRDKLQLYDWVRPRGIVDIKSTEENFGLDYTGLDIVEGQVYLSLDGYAVCTLRFPPEQPEKVCYLPKNACVAVQNEQIGGMLTSQNGRVFSCPGTVIGSNEIGLYEIKPDGDLVKMISNTKNEVNLTGKGGRWWRLGNTVYVGQVALDLYERKWHKISPLLLYDQKAYRSNAFGEVKDFFPARNDSVYLLTATSLYLVPQNWESRVKIIADLERFKITDLNRI